MDVTKLTPAPWEYIPRTSVPTIRDANGDDVFWEDRDCSGMQSQNVSDLPFVCLARNAFDVMMRRGWHAVRISSGPWEGNWFVKNELSHTIADFALPPHWSNPFTALVAADAWYAANVEQKPSAV